MSKKMDRLLADLKEIREYIDPNNPNGMGRRSDILSDYIKSQSTSNVKKASALFGLLLSSYFIYITYIITT